MKLDFTKPVVHRATCPLLRLQSGVYAKLMLFLFPQRVSQTVSSATSIVEQPQGNGTSTTLRLILVEVSVLLLVSKGICLFCVPYSPWQDIRVPAGTAPPAT